MPYVDSNGRNFFSCLLLCAHMQGEAWGGTAKGDRLLDLVIYFTLRFETISNLEERLRGQDRHLCALCPEAPASFADGPGTIRSWTTHPVWFWLVSSLLQLGTISQSFLDFRDLVILEANRKIRHFVACDFDLPDVSS